MSGTSRRSSFGAETYSASPLAGLSIGHDKSITGNRYDRFWSEDLGGMVEPP
jgi:hypothetical protein